MASDSYLTVSIDVHYGSKRILQCENLTFPNSSIIGVLGRNGAGKTTLLKCITGLFPVDGIKWNNSYRIGALIETPRFRFDWTGKEHLVYHSNLNSVEVNCIQNAIMKTGIESFIDNKVGTYSLGQKQRLGIAKALVTNPQCLILDEPTNGLDPQGIAEIRQLVKQLHNDGTNIILSSHLLSEVQACCTHLVVIGNQRVLYAGPLENYSQTGIQIQSHNKTALLDFVHSQGH